MLTNTLQVWQHVLRYLFRADSATTLFPPFSILLQLALPTPLHVAVRRGAGRQSEGVLTAAADRIVPFLSVENPVDNFTEFFE